jgi:phosphoenolpyruvate synthase/pyruvate phosphate dikinase
MAAPGMRHTRTLRELRAADAGAFGGKSVSLGELLLAEIPVPPGFALAASAFAEFLDEGGLTGRVAHLLDGVSADDLDSIAAAAHTIGEELRSAPVPESVQREIGRQYVALAGAAGSGAATEAPAVAVRSSALGEDSSEATFAGQQDTYLWVRGAEAITGAVRDCWASLYSTQAISYRMRLGGEHAARPAMGVTVQSMVDAAVSGVMFTCNPVTGDPSMVAINASWGLGLAVVGGEVTPDDYLVSKVTREIVRETINAKAVEYVPAPGGRGTVRRSVDELRQTTRALAGASIGQLVDLARTVERHFGCPQDVEWAITPAGELFVLQSRPVTTLPKREASQAPASAIAMVMSTFGVKAPKAD